MSRWSAGYASGAYTDEQVRDVVGAALVGGTNVTVTPNDPADTITVATTATVNATDAALRDRSTHTGTQAAATITGLATVATTGAYADLSGKPTIPGDATTGAKGIVQLAGDLAGTAAAPTVPGLTGKLAAASNLSDLASAATARTNLGLGTAAVVNTGTASGSVPLLSTGGLLPIARVASGTPDGTKFVRDDGTLAVPAGGGSYTDEQVRDVMGTALVAGSNVTVTVDDPGDTITVAAINPRPPLLAATGRFYAGGLTASPTAVVTASGRYYISPFWCHQAITIDQLIVEVTTAAAGVTTTLGYYPNQSGNTPVGATLQSLGTIDTTAAGIVALTLGTPLALPAGWSHFGAALTAAPRFRGNNMDDTLPVVYTNNNLAAGGPTANSYAGLWTTGTLPTTVPSGLSVGTGFRFAVRISSVP